METLPRPCRGNVSYFVFRTFVDQFSTYVTRPSEFETVGVYVSPMGGGAFFSLVARSNTEKNLVTFTRREVRRRGIYSAHNDA